ncbi:MAG: hypothetical protein JOZ92_08855 [Candidatus Dormibacteraeota bacterium]|nr:hypothetical protein [Candidatus Dormibacteraeota bacterium]
MPLPLDVKHGTLPPLRERFGRWLRRQPARPLEAEPQRPADVESIGREYWAPSAAAAQVAALVDAHERGGTSRRPRGNPAFAEAVFVELMRAQQYRRAFDHLSDDCKQRWGSAEHFAAAQAGGAMRRLQGVSVKEVHFLSEWQDPGCGRTYQEVAELKVEYVFATPGRATVLPRVVHLVPDSGRWRSLCYPV